MKMHTGKYFQNMYACYTEFMVQSIEWFGVRRNTSMNYKRKKETYNL